MIYTSRYKYFNENSCFKTVSISGDRGKKEGYKGKCYSKLAPKKEFWKVWHENLLTVNQEQNSRYYVSEYYKQVLSKLDPEEVYNELDNSILVCYEPVREFCHRHIVAAWFEILLEVEVPEVVVDENFLVEETNNTYKDYIKEYLIDAMMHERIMNGYRSLRAVYLDEKANKLEEELQQLDIKTGSHYNDLKQRIIYLRFERDKAENKYYSKTNNPVRVRTDI